MNPRKAAAIFRRIVGAAQVPPPAPPSTIAGLNHAVGLAKAWFGAGEEVTQLTHRWMELENTMMRDPDWVARSREERRFAPAQAHLTELDDLKERAQKRQHEFLGQLLTTPTQDVLGAIAKLSIVMGVMIPEDYPHCYQLIEDVTKMLAAHVCPHCHKASAEEQAQATALITDAART